MVLSPVGSVSEGQEAGGSLDKGGASGFGVSRPGACGRAERPGASLYPSGASALGGKEEVLAAWGGASATPSRDRHLQME